MEPLNHFQLLDAMYTMKTYEGSSTIDYEDEHGSVVARQCAVCENTFVINAFSLNKKGKRGVDGRCKECQKVRIYERQKSKEGFEYRLQYRKENKERIKEYASQYAKENKDKMKSAYHRRQARKRSLPSTLSERDVSELLSKFGGCFLTGSQEIHLDHVIPLASGRGGTTKQNMLPLRGDLNMSKGDKNIFEWFEDIKDRVCLSQERFDAGISYIAELNEMTPKEYRDYVYECH